MKLKDIQGKVHNKNLAPYKRKRGQESKSKGQTALGEMLAEIWPNITIYEEVPCVGTRLFLDFYIDSLSIAFEFDGKQHEQYTPFFHGDKYKWMRAKGRDETKEKWCEINGITLIRIKQEDLKDIDTIKEIIHAR